jgi:hypothetical protein
VKWGFLANNDLGINSLTVRYQGWRLTGLFAVGLLGDLYAQSNHEPAFTALSKADSARLEQQRAVVVAAVKRYGVASLSRTKADSPVLQKVIDDRVFKKSQTYELQCLGVAFGDVLASELPLRWIMVTDEYGTDPTLRFKQTTVQVNALTMISKRIERDESVDLLWLLRQTRENLAQK